MQHKHIMLDGVSLSRTRPLEAVLFTEDCPHSSNKFQQKKESRSVSDSRLLQYNLSITVQQYNATFRLFPWK